MYHTVSNQKHHKWLSFHLSEWLILFMEFGFDVKIIDIPVELIVNLNFVS